MKIISKYYYIHVGYNKQISDIISQIKPQNSLSKHVNYNTLLQLIVDEIRKFPNLPLLKTNTHVELELIKLIMSIDKSFDISCNDKYNCFIKKKILKEILSIVFSGKSFHLNYCNRH